MIITKEMIKIATFDLIPTDFVFEYFFYFSEQDAFSLNFEEVGVESVLLLQNLGFALIVIMFHILLVVIHAMAYKCRNSNCCCKKVNNKIGSYLYWNGLIRLYMEVCFDLTLFAFLNVYMMNWETQFVSEKLSNYISIGLSVILISLPIGLPVYFCKNKDRFHKEEFQEKCGAFVEGTNVARRYKAKWTSVAVPLIMIGRRVVFVLVVCLAGEHLFFQLASQNFVALGMIIFYQWFNPLES